MSVITENALRVQPPVQVESDMVLKSRGDVEPPTFAPENDPFPTTSVFTEESTR